MPPTVSTALIIAVPTFTVLVGIIFNRLDSNALRVEMNNLRTDLHRDMTTLRTDVHQEMTAFRDMIHDDLMGVHERLRAVETRQGM